MRVDRYIWVRDLKKTTAATTTTTTKVNGGVYCLVSSFKKNSRRCITGILSFHLFISAV